LAAIGRHEHNTAVWTHTLFPEGKNKKIDISKKGWTINFPKDIKNNSIFSLFWNLNFMDAPSAINATGAAEDAIISTNLLTVNVGFTLSCEKTIPKQTAIKRGWDTILVIKFLMISIYVFFLSEKEIKKEVIDNKTMVSASKINPNGNEASTPNAIIHIGIPIYP